MPAKKLKEFLDDHHIQYEIIPHSPAYTAQEIAAAAHVPGREMVKTVMLEVDGKMEMAVLPANERVDVFRRILFKRTCSEVKETYSNGT